MDQSKNTYDVRIESMVYGGDAFSRLPDGRALFVPFALPGEKVRVEIVEEQRGHAKGRLVEVLEPSPDRIQLRCQHFGVCGGCHYQHMAYPLQLATKQSIVREQFARIAGIPDAPVKTIIPSPADYQYRNAIQFHLSPQGRLGFQAAHSNQVVEIQECWLPEKQLADVWPQLDFDASPDVERISLRLGDSGDVLMTLESAAESLPELNVEGGISVVHLREDQQVVLAGEDFLLMSVLERTFQVSAGSFFQVNTRQAEAMVEYVLDKAGLTPADTLMELYCGVGLFSLFLAPRVKRLVGVELSPFACEDFAANLEAFDNVELYQGMVEHVLPGLKLTPDLVLADPPRAGIDRRALDAIIAAKPPRIIYTSCDPSTLARDVKRLANAGYRLDEVQPFDLFPQTYHVECVVSMSRGKRMKV